MAHVLIRALALLRRPWVTGGVAGLILGGIFLVRLPLFGVPGFELSAALTLATALFGGGVGMAAGRQEQVLLAGTGTRPTRAKRIENPVAAVGAAVGASATLLTFALVFPLGVSIGVAAFTTRCNPFAQLGFFPLLTLPAVALASAAGVFVALFTRRLWLSWFLYIGMGLLSLAATLWPVYDGPQVFAYNLFAGYFPGPLYDEALSLPPALLWFRLQTLLVAGALLALSALLVNLREGTLGFLPKLRPLAFVYLVVFLGGALWIEDRAEALGIRRTNQGVMVELGGTKETAHARIYYPRAFPPEAVDRMARDTEFRYAQIQAFLGDAPTGKVEVFVYASGDQKADLVGARHTQFSKPWQQSIHLNAAPFPHPALKHELVHAMSSAWGTGPLRVPGRGLVATSMGLVEGLAVAIDPPRSELTLMQEAAALRKANLAPNVRHLFDPAGFYGVAGPRAYATAGAFVLYLKDTYGRDRLKNVYATGDFPAAYERTLTALAFEWERHLDGVPLPEGAVSRITAKYRQESLFSRPCAREVATLAERAAQSLMGQPQEALDLFNRCAALQPDDPRFGLGRAVALEKLQRSVEADRVLKGVETTVEGKPTLLAEVVLARADLAWRSQGAKAAEPLLARALSLAPTPEVERTAQVKLYAIQHPPLTRALMTYFEPNAEELRLAVLDAARDRVPDDPFVRYLLGRRLLAHAPLQASAHLAIATKAPPEAIRREAWRLYLDALFQSGDCAGVRDAVGKLPDLGVLLRDSATEWQERCTFEEQRLGGPLVPEDPFR